MHAHVNICHDICEQSGLIETDLEMVRAFAIILVKQLGKNNNRITNKKVGNMSRKKVVDPCSAAREQCE